MKNKLLTVVVLGLAGFQLAAQCPITMPLLGGDTNFVLHGVGSPFSSGVSYNCNAGPFYVWANEPASITNPNNDVFTPCIKTDYNLYYTTERNNGTETFYEGGTNIGCVGPGLGCAFPIGGTVPPLSGLAVWDLYLNYLNPTLSHGFVFTQPGGPWSGPPVITLEDCWTSAALPSAIPTPVTWTSAMTTFTCTVPANTSIGTANYSITPTGSGAIFDFLNGYVYVDPSFLSPGAYTLTYTFTGSHCPGGATSTFNFTIVNPYTATWAAPSNLCSNGACVNLNPQVSGTAGGTWSGTGVSGNQFCPSTSGAGTFPVNYTVGISPTCGATQTDNIIVTATPTVTASATTGTICTGQSATLNGGGATSYTWNPGGSNASSVSVNPASTTTYVLTGANGVCLGSNSVTVIVNPLPIINITAGSGTICQGQNDILTASGGSTYTWSANAGSATTSTVSVSPTSNTTYTVTGTNVNGCTNTQTSNVTVNPTPTITASATSPTVCATQNTTLNASGATTYTWMPGNVNGNSVSVSPASSGIYTVSGTTGGCSSSSTVAVTVNPLPTVNINAGPASICTGQSSTLTATGATNYTWSPNAGSATTSTVNVTPGSTAIYTVTGITNGCTSTATTQVSVGAMATLSITATQSNICTGQSTTLTGSGGASYTWTPGNILTNTITVNPTSNTTYTLTGLSGGCAGTQTFAVGVTATPTVSVNTSGNAICSGQVVTFTASGAASYTWMPGGGNAATFTASPTSNTSYTLTGANGSCTNSAISSVAVTATPTITAVAASATLCSGQSSTLTGGGATTFTWMPGNLNTSTITINPSTNTTYTLSGSNGNCIASQTVAVQVNATPTLSIAASNGNICSGQTATLTASGATTFTWMPGGSNASTLTVSPSGNSSYTVSGTTNGCNNFTVSAIIVTPTPTVTAIAGTSTLCSGQSSVLTGGGASTYTWLPGNQNTTTVTVNPASNTTYTLVGANGNCLSSQTVALIVNPSPTVNAVAGSGNICSGQSDVLTASGATTYTWMPGGANTNTISVSPNSTTNYTVTGVSGGCTGTFITTVSVTATPTLIATASSGTLCAGSPATLTGTGLGTYTWMPGNQNSASITVNPLANTTYTLVSLNGNCPGATTVSVIVNPTPTFTNNGIADSALCGKSNGGYQNIGISGGNTPYHYQWYNGTTPIPGDTNAILSNAAAGSYTLIVTDSRGCIATGGAISYTVPGSAAVVALFTANPNVGQAPLNVSFVNASTAGGSYFWNFGNGFNSNVQNPSAVTYSTTGVYSVTLFVDVSGCAASYTATILVEEPTTIIIPNIFTPNGDGLNDEFFIKNTGLSNLTCNIFDRWGVFVFSIQSPQEVWDGRTPGGEKASEGTYFFILKALGLDGKSYQQQGPLTLLR